MSYKTRIKFDNREWLVIDNFEYEGTRYFYIIEDISAELKKIDNIEDYDGKFHLEFIYKIENGNYRNVTDKVLINKLLDKTGARLLTEKENVNKFKEYIKSAKESMQESDT